ncbi:hypothetical protein ACFOU0_12920 [Salinicoccus sesuvii]|uniref:Uncharacterized protein n=1 Tax=Salinicoccus sesuvii TaxID=868281 RepID=A0ABV7N7C0_9STAP
MNDKVKKAVTLLPVVLVPLFNERNRIKKHPDVQKLSKTSNTIYHSAKDKSTSAAQTVKSASTSTYQTGRNAVSKVGDAVADRRTQHAYKKEHKQYQKNLQQEEALLKQFEKEKEKHRKQRLKEQDQSAIPVPKIMQSDAGKNDNEDKSHAMTIDDAYKASEVKSPETKAEMKSNPDNHGFATEYKTDQSSNRASLTEEDEARLEIDAVEPEQTNNNNEQERFDHMDQNMNYWIDNKVKGHETDSYENGKLFTKHKNRLDPKHAVTAKKKTEKEDSLFNRHRDLHETKMTEKGRKTGESSAITKSKRQKKLEKKIEKHKQKQYN